MGERETERELGSALGSGRIKIPSEPGEVISGQEWVSKLPSLQRPINSKESLSGNQLVAADEVAKQQTTPDSPLLIIQWKPKE